jgi:hypothetical protein
LSSQTLLKDGNPYPSNLNQLDKSVRGKLFTALSLLSTFIIFFGWRVVCGTCEYQQGMNDMLLGLGGWESMIIYPLLIWLIGFWELPPRDSGRPGLAIDRWVGGCVW